jgi:L-ascorbate metabolism protein UlaG (beta-lactamase superfamily)
MKKYMLIFLLSVPALFLIGFLFMQQKSFGQQPKEERLTRIKQSPNYKNGKFKNLTDIPVMAEEASFFKMTREFFRSHANAEPSTAIPSIKSDLKKQTEDSIKIFWFGHSSYLIKTGNANILVDPIFSKRASPVSFTGVKSFEGSLPFTINDLPNIDVMVITHDHYDHMDYRTILNLKERTNCYIVPLGVGQHLEHWGINKSKITELDWWETKELIQGMKITATPAQHFSGRGFVRNKTLWASFVLQTDSSKIFIGGDSGYGDHYKEIGNKFGPFDIVMLESGQYNKYWPYIHMMPEQTVQAAIDLKAKVLMPVHWGKFKLSWHPWNEPIKRVLAKATQYGVTVTTPLIGEPIVLEGTLPQKHWFENVER